MGRLKESTRKYILFLFVFCKHLKQEGTTSKKLNKNYKKIEKLSKTEQKLQKNIHTIYLFLLKTTLIKKNVTLQLYTHTRLLVKKRLLYLNSFELAFFFPPYILSISLTILYLRHECLSERISFPPRRWQNMYLITLICI